MVALACPTYKPSLQSTERPYKDLPKNVRIGLNLLLNSPANIREFDGFMPNIDRQAVVINNLPVHLRSDVLRNIEEQLPEAYGMLSPVISRYAMASVNNFRLPNRSAADFSWLSESHDRDLVQNAYDHIRTGSGFWFKQSTLAVKGMYSYPLINTSTDHEGRGTIPFVYATLFNSMPMEAFAEYVPDFVASLTQHANGLTSPVIRSMLIRELDPERARIVAAKIDMKEISPYYSPIIRQMLRA